MGVERFYTFKSGWSIDLSKVFYIGTPKIDGAKAELKIGIELPNNPENKDVFIIHEEDLNSIYDKVYIIHRTYLQNEYESIMLKTRAEDRERAEQYSESTGLVSSALASLSENMCVDRQHAKSSKIASQYIEWEFKQTVNELTKAVAEYINSMDKVYSEKY